MPLEPKKVRRIRNATGAHISQCRSALWKADGDFQKAMNVMLHDKEDVEFISEIEEAYDHLFTQQSVSPHEMVVMMPPGVEMEEAAVTAADTAEATGKVVLLAHEGYGIVVSPGMPPETIMRLAS